MNILYIVKGVIQSSMFVGKPMGSRYHGLDMAVLIQPEKSTFGH